MNQKPNQKPNRKLPQPDLWLTTRLTGSM